MAVFLLFIPHLITVFTMYLLRAASQGDGLYKKERYKTLKNCMIYSINTAPPPIMTSVEENFPAKWKPFHEVSPFK